MNKMNLSVSLYSVKSVTWHNFKTKTTSLNFIHCDDLSDICKQHRSRWDSSLRSHMFMSTLLWNPLFWSMNSPNTLLDHKSIWESQGWISTLLIWGNIQGFSTVQVYRIVERVWRVLVVNWYAAIAHRGRVFKCCRFFWCFFLPPLVRDNWNCIFTVVRPDFSLVLDVGLSYLYSPERV